MNRKDEDLKLGKENRNGPEEMLEPELREALGNFKSSVTAWSEAMMPRERPS